MSFCTYINTCEGKVLKAKLPDQRVCVFGISIDVKLVSVEVVPNFTTTIGVSFATLQNMSSMKAGVFCLFISFLFSP